MGWFTSDRRADEKEKYDAGRAHAKNQGTVERVLDDILFGFIDAITEDKQDPYVRGKDDYKAGKPYRPHK